MFTPNELKEISFDKAVFGGYDISDVDKLFSALCEDYTTLFKENTMLKKKLMLLADTVEDYRSVDEAMRKALITAQNMANEMVADAEKKSKEMLATASDDARARIRELTAMVEAEERKLLEARKATADFIDNITAMFASEGERFAALKAAVEPPKSEPAAPAASAEMSDTLDEIARSLDAKVMEEEAAREAEKPVEAEKAPQAEAAPAEEESTVTADTISFESDIPTEEEMAALEAAAEKPSRRKRVVFENLRFGTDYDIKDDE